YLTDALQEHGFVDICAGRASSSGREAQAGQSEQGELDVPTAAEFAAQFGEQVASCSIDRILEIVVRPDPRYTLKLLT
ncbi:MAG: hypothetical protein JW993_11600, partial [Sedimentisphaerales bacterium]|nr:hypothetical protein [Sedimentisphaerales bacterium]